MGISLNNSSHCTFFKMVKKTKGRGKKVAATPAFARKAVAKKVTNPLFEKKVQKLWNWTRHSTKEGLEPFCEMAQVHPSPETKSCIAASFEGSPSNQPI